jgi:branched-chain amino acid transport system ATP-binding protein
MTPILEMQGVTKRFGGLRAVKDVSLAMNEGEILFIIGPNGAGKTTVFNLISGFLHPNEGRIFFQGKDISRMAPSCTPAISIVPRKKRPGFSIFFRCRT